MTTALTVQEKRLRRGFKIFNKAMVALWRLNLGNWMNAWPSVGGQIMVVTHTGRKSGLPRRTPVNFALVDGDLYCTAGFGEISDWYRNIRLHPRVEVWLPEGWWSGVAEDVSSSPDRLFLMRQVLIGSGFAARVFGMDPYTISEVELARFTEPYRLVRIRLQTACTGPGGPGDLAWVWPLATLLLFPMVFFRRKK
jgi:deazaflavin-dependent oxidoreductase (nitroreductase family)